MRYHPLSWSIAGAWAVIAAGALATAACGVTPLVVPAIASASSAGDAVILNGSRSLLLAHNAYQATATAATAAVNAGALNREQLLQLRELNRRAYAILSAADQVQSRASRAAELFRITDQLAALIGAPPGRLS